MFPRYQLLNICATALLLSLPLSFTSEIRVALAQSTDSEAGELNRQESGMLQTGDPTASDGSLYDEYTFAGQAGQAVLITLESTQFDTYLLLLNPGGDPIAANDDLASDSTNSRLAVVLPADGSYRVRANAYDPKGQGQYRLAIQTVAPDTPEFLAAQANQLLEQGQQQLDQQQFEAALELINQSLAIYRQLKDRAGEGNALYAIGDVYYYQSHYAQAIEFYQQSLVIWQELGDRQREAKTLNDLGASYNNLGEYSQAMGYYQQSLSIYKEISDQSNEGTLLNNVGFIYDLLGQYDQALNYYQQALSIYIRLGDREGEGTTLNNIGGVYDLLGEYPQALEYYRQSLSILKEIGDREGEGNSLNNIGLVYDHLGQYDQALNYYRQSLSVLKEIGDRSGEGATLNNIGLIYDSLGGYEQALEYYQQSLSIQKEIGNRSGEGTALNNIGFIYSHLSQYPQALEYYQQSLSIRKEIGDRSGEGSTLNNIGLVYIELGQYDRALSYYQQSLSIRKEIGDRSGEGQSLNNIGYALEAQNQPELAIVFLKQSVNRYEAIRESNRTLSQDLQQSYTGTIESTYRRLADLLLRQDRVLEAQQVLDLLKVQELDDYLRGVRGPDDRLTVLRPEEEILKRYEELQRTAIQIGQELAQLRQKLFQGNTLNDAETQRIDQLAKLQEAINQQFTTFLASAEIQTFVAQLSSHTIQQTVALSDMAGLQDDLANLNAVLLYPLILEDRLELVITTPTSAPLRRTVNVSKADLTRLISDLRQALREPTIDPKPLAQQLYRYLIEPIEPDLAQVAANLPNGQTPTIIYSPDGALRYIPLAALYDGNQWLVERYRVNNITAKSLTEFQSVPASSPRVLAGAFADAAISYRVSIDGQEEEFRGLPFAGREVENLASMLTNITEFVDRDFGWNTIRRYMGASNIVHFATHAAFVPGDPQNSFILFGNGDRALLECSTAPTSDSLSCINNWSLSNIDLVVLSACETGLSGALQTNEKGEEILGLGYQFQNRGARAVLASLWKVSDGGTQALMDGFD